MFNIPTKILKTLPKEIRFSLTGYLIKLSNADG